MADEVTRWTHQRIVECPQGIGDLALLRDARDAGFDRWQVNGAVSLLLQIGEIERDGRYGFVVARERRACAA